MPPHDEVLTQPPLAGRTEQQVAADTILALLHARLIKGASPANMLHEASIATRVPIAELRQAQQRWEIRRSAVAPGRAPTLASAVSPAEPPPVTARLPEPAPARPTPVVVPPHDLWAPLAPYVAYAENLEDFWPEPQVRASAPPVREIPRTEPPPPAPRGDGDKKPEERHRHRRSPGMKKLCLCCRTPKYVSKFRLVNETTGRRASMCLPCEEDRANRILDVTREDVGQVRLGFTIHDGDGTQGMLCGDCQLPLNSGEVVEAVGPLAHRHCPPPLGHDHQEATVDA